MGADLYINSLYEKAQEKYRPLIEQAIKNRDKATTPEEVERWQKEVERLREEQDQDGYYRDSYNDSSILWQIGLSWWGNVTPLLDKEGCLPLAKVKWLLDKVKAWKVPSPGKIKFKNPLSQGDETFPPLSEEDMKDWHEYFTKKKRRLEEFLIRSIELEESPYCSL